MTTNFTHRFTFRLFALAVCGALGCQSFAANPRLNIWGFGSPMAPFAPNPNPVLPVPPSSVFAAFHDAPQKDAPPPIDMHPKIAAPIELGTLVDKPEPPKWPAEAKSNKLPSGLYNPMPGGVVSGYRADTGLDIMGIKFPVYAIASGWVDYAESGHTLWTGPRDTANCVRIELDEPIAYRGRKVTHIYYAHLSKLVHIQPEGHSPRARVEAGDMLGVSGVANGSWHLHLGFLLDGEVEQYHGTFLYEDEIREVMGGYRNGNRLPKE